MKRANSRRAFIKHNTLAGIGGLMMGRAVSYAGSSNSQSAGSPGSRKIGGMTLEQLRDQYKSALFTRFIPNMDSLVIDPVYGGFMCDVDIVNRKQLSSNKKVWSEGRGIWVYSFLYNYFGHDPHFLDVARKSKDFILKNQPAESNFWNASFSREGNVLPGAGDIYGNLYLAEGLAEFAKASGEHQYLDMARKMLLSAVEAYDRDDYPFEISYGPAGAPGIHAPRVVGHWMVFLRTATQVLEQESFPDIQLLAQRCVEAIMKHHLDTHYGLLHEALDHDFNLPDNEWAQFTYFATGIQALWMVMAEAIRIKDSGLFDKSLIAFKKHVDLAFDPVYGGYFRSLVNMAACTYKLDKVLSLQEEILIGTLLVLEHKEDAWAENRFADTYSYVTGKFSHPEFAFVVESGDRKMISYNKRGVGNYHHPRHLMLNLLALERIINRKGKVAGLFGI
jgi:mannose/cellobiose epimerase-like protein (N-acyl-D-glucosamine 2-epimerase family)